MSHWDEIEEKVVQMERLLAAAEKCKPRIVTAENKAEHYRQEAERLRLALKPFAEVGERFIFPVESGAIPAGTSLARLNTGGLLVSDLVAAAKAFTNWPVKGGVNALSEVRRGMRPRQC